LINVQLIDARTDTHLWAEAYNRKIEDVFAVEQEVAKTVAEALQAIALYRQAIAEDPRFALAEAKLSIALSDLYWNGGTRELSPRLLGQQSREAMAAAKQLQPDLPEANLALAFVKYRLDLDYPAALAGFDTVLAARPAATGHPGRCEQRAAAAAATAGAGGHVRRQALEDLRPRHPSVNTD
jgi:hypothetical protein